MTQIDGEIFHVYVSEEYSENKYTTQSNLQIQCNPYQATSGIFTIIISQFVWKK